jgi:membrane peptidoglycan carboxypeptidase
MNKFLKYLGSVLTIAVLTISTYYIYSLYEARIYTKETILLDIEASRWRSPNGIVKEFEIYSDDLTERQKEILIKVQDPGFYNHEGIDLSTPGAGLTTITQAIVKKLYFEEFKSGIAKIKQSLIARFVVNDLIPKNDQLNLFINVMYFGKVDGNPVVGLESAANAYYSQPIKDLTEERYISLIAMLVMPGTFHIIDHPEWNRDRTNRIKALIAGKYNPKGLMDQFYGKLPQEIIDHGLPKASYFEGALKTNDIKGNTPNKANSAAAKSRAAD